MVCHEMMWNLSFAGFENEVDVNELDNFIKNKTRHEYIKEEYLIKPSSLG